MKKLGLALVILLLVSGCHKTFNYIEVRKSFLHIQHTVTVHVCDEGQCQEADASISGSGFMLSKTAEATWGMTAAHLCAGPSLDPKFQYESNITITDIYGRKFRVEEAFVHMQTDVCILKLPAALDLPALPIATAPPQLGDKVFTVSAPSGIFNAGMVPMFEGRYVGETPSQVLQINLAGYTLPTVGGSSGAPVLDAAGEVVGMTIMSRLGFETFALSVPYSVLAQISRNLPQ